MVAEEEDMRNEPEFETKCLSLEWFPALERLGIEKCSSLDD
jgi:hypothetical protein